METLTTDLEMKKLATDCIEYANGYYMALLRGLTSSKRFNNDLRYNMAVMCVEKYFVGLLASYDQHAEHHMPQALFNEAKAVEPELTDTMKQTCILVGKFEAICSLEGFGYRTPTDADIEQMITGIGEIKALVEKRINSLG
ncbi:MAG: hypothetical protein JXR39_11090 [Marinilabiliaceae bacterium]|nr:hypothetical protein [Marinilabiliaceae bacterium]